jgi:hypothetical protein
LAIISQAALTVSEAFFWSKVPIIDTPDDASRASLFAARKTGEKGEWIHYSGIASSTERDHATFLIELIDPSPGPVPLSMRH